MGDIIHRLTQEDLERRIEVYNQIAEQAYRPLMDRSHLGFKGYLIGDDGSITTVYHDWYVEAKRQIDEYLERKRKDLCL